MIKQVEKRKRPYIFIGAGILFLIMGMGWITLGLEAAVPAEQEPVAYLPAIRTPLELPPAPTPAVDNGIVRLQITPNTHINASTYNTSSFIIENLSLQDKKISKIRIDFTASLFPDMVFDPSGLAGDTVAKDINIDAGGSWTGYVKRDYLQTDAHDGGYDAVELTFNDFGPQKRMEFSVDVDPTSIQGSGAPGPYESGSVSGLELTGATVTATFDDNTVLVGQTYWMPGSASGSEATLRQGMPPRPVVTAGDDGQSIHIAGESWHSYRVFVVEGGLFLDGLPGGGFDIDPLEANSAIALREYTGELNPYTGEAVVDLLLTKTHPDGGLNYIVVVLENSYGVRGAVSEPLVLQVP